MARGQKILIPNDTRVLTPRGRRLFLLIPVLLLVGLGVLSRFAPSAPELTKQEAVSTPAAIKVDTCISALDNVPKGPGSYKRLMEEDPTAAQEMSTLVNGLVDFAAGRHWKLDPSDSDGSRQSLKREFCQYRYGD
jgi:hypothetical protein